MRRFWTLRARPAGQARDEGMTLIEVMVALGLFAILSTSVLMMVTTAAGTTREDGRRQVANYLASRELEVVRDAFESAVRGPDTVLKNAQYNPSPLPGGTVGQPLVVDGIPYRVKRVMRPVSIGSTAATPCDEGTSSELSYYEVEVEVTWSGLGDRPPVRMTTIMTPRKGTYSNNDGHIGLKVVSAAGDPQGDVPATAKQTVGANVGATRSGSTASDGCVLLAQLGAGTYSVTVSKPGFVDRNGNATATLTASVLARQLWRTSIEYDQAASIAVTLKADYPDYVVPPTTTLPVTLGNSGLTPSGTRTIAGTGTVRTLTDLWPFASGYQAWAGGCAANNPGDAAAAPITSEPGGAATGDVTLASLRVKGAVGSTITARQAVDAGCTSQQVVTLGVMPAGGVMKTSLPYGTWTLSRSGSGTTRSVTLKPGQLESAIQEVSL